MTEAEAYTLWAHDLDRRRKAIIASRPPGLKVEVAEPGSPLADQRLMHLYRLLRARDEENSANEMAELARRRAAKAKPASTSGDA